jgi:hypothetical protein
LENRRKSRNLRFCKEFRKVTSRQGERAATHRRDGTASGLGSYTENISHVFKLSLTVEIELCFLHSPMGRNGPSGTQRFFFAQHTVQLEDATDLDVIVADAKLVGIAFNPGGHIEPVAPLSNACTRHIPHVHIEAEICASNCST